MSTLPVPESHTHLHSTPAPVDRALCLFRLSYTNILLSDDISAYRLPRPQVCPLKPGFVSSTGPPAGLTRVEVSWGPRDEFSKNAPALLAFCFLLRVFLCG